MAYKLKQKKEKTMLKLKIGDDVVYGKNMKELNKKLKDGVILWNYKAY
jgi:hypothetical protein